MAIDSSGRTDSVIIGFDDRATMGIDEAFGEENVYYNWYTEPDIRSIHRNIVTERFNWLEGGFDGGVPPFKDTADYKVEYRSYQDMNHFVLDIHSNNYPVTIKVKNYNFYQPVGYTAYNKRNFEIRGARGTFKIFFEENKTDVMYIINEEKEIKYIDIYTYWISGIKNSELNNQNLKLYPNPCSNLLCIETSFPLSDNIQIFDILGKVVYSESFMNKNKTLINVTALPKGYYFVKSKTKTSQVISSFIKN
jgi:hypothetical protein